MNKSFMPKPIAAAILGVGLAQPAFTQQLEEVLVTAQVRAESMQDVPISMVAMSGEQINEQAITKMEDFTMNMPAVTVAAIFSFIR